MASYTTMNSVDASSEEIKLMMVAKAHELFAVCDKEKKGFITKRDMQRLQTELPLSPDQLEDVFDSLDDDHNGYLTLDEFTDGFGGFVGLGSSMSRQRSLQSMDSGEHVYENDRGALPGAAGVVGDIDEEHFDDMVSHVGASNLFEDVDMIKSLWVRLRKDEPELLSSFEEFLAKVTNEIKRSQKDFETLESALRNKSSVHDEEVRRLYEEMEQQIKLEKERVMAEEKARERAVREEMERALSEKDAQLMELLSRHQKMEERMRELNSQEAETKQENERLAKQKEELEEMLKSSECYLEDSKYAINELKSKQRDEKRERAMAALQISEGIALERESLVKQLDMLREMNRKLRDERDEADLRRNLMITEDAYDGCDTCENELEAGAAAAGSPPGSPAAPGAAPATARRRRKQQLSKQGSVMSEYFKGPNRLSSRFHSDSDDDDQHFSVQRNVNRSKNSTYTSGESDYDSNSTRREPLGAQDNTLSPKQEEEDLTGKAPERVFKIVFVGDSGVGKSSFIHRFCNNVFKSTFSATIGVDFQVRNIRVDGRIVALQLWDTAGQERFRSITKQYFRKADGVLIMYDVTSESSFKNVRNWITSVQDGVEEGTVLSLIGNKLDLVDNDESRPVSTKDGIRLSEEHGSLFFETSAKSGMNVSEALQAMASLLREREDRQLENALNLTDDAKKKTGCCN